MICWAMLKLNSGGLWIAWANGMTGTRAYRVPAGHEDSSNCVPAFFDSGKAVPLRSVFSQEARAISNDFINGSHLSLVSSILSASIRYCSAVLSIRVRLAGRSCLSASSSQSRAFCLSRFVNCCGLRIVMAHSHPNGRRSKWSALGRFYDPGSGLWIVWKTPFSDLTRPRRLYSARLGSEPIRPQDRVPFAARFVDLVRQRSIVLRGSQQPIALLRQQVLARAVFTINGVLSKPQGQ